MIVAKAESEVALSAQDLARLEPDEPVMLTAEDMVDPQVAKAEAEAVAEAESRLRDAELGDLMEKIAKVVDEAVARKFAELGQAPRVAKSVKRVQVLVRGKDKRVERVETTETEE